MASSSGAKVANICEKLLVSKGNCVTLHSEAEEETGSAEEQPASNRLSHYTDVAEINIDQMELKLLNRITLVLAEKDMNNKQLAELLGKNSAVISK